MCPDQYAESHADTVGLPTPVVEFCVVDDEGNRCPPGELGEIAMRGGIVISGYLGESECANAFQDGWHFSDDLGLIDEDGFVVVRGRQDDLIIRGGENVHPIEIREAIAEHPAVLESTVASFPDEVLGNRILLAVVPKEGTRLTEDEIASFCADRLAEFKRPDIYRILDELPRNPSGKILVDEVVPDCLTYGIKAGE